MIIDVALRALISQWPLAIGALLLAYIAWNVRGIRDRFVTVEEKVERLDKRTTTVEGEVNRLKGAVGLNGGKA